MGDQERTPRRAHRDLPRRGYEPTAEDARFWAIAEAAEFPLGIHIGSFSESGLQPTVAQSTLSFLAHAGGSKAGADSIPAATKVLFSGACQRFPRLRFVIVEGNIGWIPTAMEQVDDMFLRYRWYTGAADVMSTMPSRVFHRFWATFMIDSIGIELRHHMNVRHLMWSWTTHGDGLAEQPDDDRASLPRRAADE